MSYEDSGFDAFLSRSVDSIPQPSLDAPGPISTQFRYDAGQSSGSLGDSFKVGNIRVNGKSGLFSVSNTLDVGQTDTGDGIALKDTGGNTVLDIVRDSKNHTRMAVTDDKAIQRLYAGRFPDGSVKIKLSQPSYDVETATDDQLIWSSDFNSFKIVKSGTYTFPAVTVPNSTTVTQTKVIPHLQSGTPAVLLYSQNYKNANSYPGQTGFPASFYTILSASLNAPNSSDPSGIFYVEVSHAIDATNLYLNRVLTEFGSGDKNVSELTIRYYIFKETAT